MFVNKDLGFDPWEITTNLILAIEKLNFINNKGLSDSLFFVFKNPYKDKYSYLIKIFNNLSNYENFT